MQYETNFHNHQLLQWYLDAGVDEAVEDAPVDYYSISRKVSEEKRTPTEPVKSPPQTGHHQR